MKICAILSALGENDRQLAFREFVLRSLIFRIFIFLLLSAHSQ